jgi:mannosyltransferase OCH1-like enzyme
LENSFFILYSICWGWEDFLSDVNEHSAICHLFSARLLSPLLSLLQVIQCYKNTTKSWMIVRVPGHPVLKNTHKNTIKSWMIVRVPGHPVLKNTHTKKHNQVMNDCKSTRSPSAKKHTHKKNTTKSWMIVRVPGHPVLKNTHTQKRNQVMNYCKSTRSPSAKTHTHTHTHTHKKNTTKSWIIVRVQEVYTLYCLHIKK